MPLIGSWLCIVERIVCFGAPPPPLDFAWRKCRGWAVKSTIDLVLETLSEVATSSSDSFENFKKCLTFKWFQKFQQESCHCSARHNSTCSTCWSFLAKSRYSEPGDICTVPFKCSLSSSPFLLPCFFLSITCPSVTWAHTHTHTQPDRGNKPEKLSLPFGCHQLPARVICSILLCCVYFISIFNLTPSKHNFRSITNGRGTHTPKANFLLWPSRVSFNATLFFFFVVRYVEEEEKFRPECHPELIKHAHSTLVVVRWGVSEKKTPSKCDGKKVWIKIRKRSFRRKT